MDPVEVGKADTDEMNLVLLSYPVQKLIVRHLQSSPNDLINLGNVFPCMAEVADLTKTTWMFEKIFPTLVGYLTKNDSLKCRLVCHRWMQVVDNVLQNLGIIACEPDYGEPLRSSQSLSQHWSKETFVLPSYWFQMSDTYSSFMDKMAGQSRSPLASRCLQVNNVHDPQHWQEVTQFLERFGSNIWKLVLDCDFSYLRATVITRNILALVPNLKMLSLGFNEIDPADLTEEESEEIRQDLEQTPFPPLPNLTFMESWCICSEFCSAALSQYSNHLVHMNLAGTHFLNNYDSGIHGSFPNLKTLVVKVWDSEELSKLCKFTSLLKRITTFSDNFILYHDYFKVFHHFSGTLESINIEFTEEYGDWIPGEGTYYELEILEFPVLKSVRFENPDPMESFDTLLHLKPGPSSLQISTFPMNWLQRFRNYQQPLFEVMADERIEIHGYLERMYDSKIWELMPQLQNIDVQAFNPINEAIGVAYKRSEWRQQQAYR